MKLTMVLVSQLFDCGSAWWTGGGPWVCTAGTRVFTAGGTGLMAD